MQQLKLHCTKLHEWKKIAPSIHSQNIQSKACKSHIMCIRRWSIYGSRRFLKEGGRPERKDTGSNHKVLLNWYDLSKQWARVLPTHLLNCDRKESICTGSVISVATPFCISYVTCLSTLRLICVLTYKLNARAPLRGKLLEAMDDPAPPEGCNHFGIIWIKEPTHSVTMQRI
jgi:hypothetical protein